MNQIWLEYDSFCVASRTHMFGPHMENDNYITVDGTEVKRIALATIVICLYVFAISI